MKNSCSLQSPLLNLMLYKSGYKSYFRHKSLTEQRFNKLKLLNRIKTKCHILNVRVNATCIY